MKIPERSVYGSLRKIQDFEKVDIYIDKWDGYGNKNSEFLTEDNRNKLKNIILNCKLNVE